MNQVILMRLLFTLLLLTTQFSYFTTRAQGYLKASGKQIVNGKGNPVILRGVGLGGWMLQEGYMLRVSGIGQQQHVIRKHLADLVGATATDNFYAAWRANHTRKVDIDSMAKWGFNSVRLPMHYNLFTLPVDQEPIAGQNTWLNTGFALTDSLLKWCAANKMYLILDLHAAPGGQGNDLNIADRDPSGPSLWESEANRQKMIALWRKLAERYANEPWIGGYDIINEPNWGFEKEDDRNGCGEQTNAPLKQLMVDMTKAIREVDKNHIIIIEGNCWGNNYNGIMPPWDGNMVLSFHKYWNYNDAASLQRPLEMRETYNVPVWLGESGENSNVWFRNAIHLLEANEIGWAWWPLKKLGYNNPLEVKVPADYQKILDYWEGKGKRPGVAEAERGLKELTDNLKLENCIYHKDVIDAMFRQTHTTATVPFVRHVAKPGLEIMAVDYDLGRNGFAYYDLDTANYWVSNGGGDRSVGNRGDVYRNDGVDISRDAGGQLVVDHFEAGEWLKYSIDGTGSKTYDLSLSMSSDAPATVNVEVNGKVRELTISNTQGQWQVLKWGKVSIKKGNNVIKVSVIQGEPRFRLMQLN